MIIRWVSLLLRCYLSRDGYGCNLMIRFTISTFPFSVIQSTGFTFLLFIPNKSFLGTTSLASVNTGVLDLPQFDPNFNSFAKHYHVSKGSRHTATCIVLTL